MKLKFKLILIFLLLFAFAKAQTVIPLYNGPIPGAIKDESYVEKQHIGEDGKRYLSFVSKPTIAVFQPPKGKANGTSVIICPGGGYQVLAVEHEGEELAKRFNDAGITAFVLKYRLPSAAIMTDKSMAPLQDLQQAILIVRRDAAKWNLNPAKIGVLGASAGGHLAATAGVHFEKSYIENPQKISLKPDFMILLYPRISMELGSESSSAKNLLGPDFKPALMNFFSLDKQVTTNTPPTFLLHASDDPVVKVEHSILFYQALVEKKVPAEMHIYKSGGHGFGLNNKTSTDDWFLILLHWLKDSELIKG
ncbi:alpha/beta hydrolase [Pedobacter mucosus]|uniref:alpha/beta hydrolase n=1 Tax=Pedobacter mucosus TaxID=2895286 RepID=UPI001EE3ABA0|nr:alpha/beta hydrolase [Pedobacter mucosus]UKT64929.1 alpha/beta hydrolase [Pedobacter mucosus]